MQEELRGEKEKLAEMQSQAKISEERSRKTLKANKKEYKNLRAKLIRLRGKIWIYLRLRSKVNTDQEN